MHHSLLTVPWFADRVGFQLLGQRSHFTLSLPNIIEYTPLHVFYGGTEAVIIFFVLSGYVLVYSVNQGTYYSYLRNRLIRLYVPIFVSVSLASVLILIYDRKTLFGGSWWLNSHAIKFSTSSYLKNLIVLAGSDWLDSSLWTMKYEIIFSFLIMTVAGFVFKKSNIHFSRTFFVLIIFIYISASLNWELVGWITVFFCGSAIHKLPERKISWALAQVLFGINILFLPWCFAGFGYSLSQATCRILMVIGAVIVLDVCRQPGNSVSHFLSKSILLIAGKYSYSLYLIHAPILTTVWFVMGQPASPLEWMLNFVVGLICIGIGTLIAFELGEKPSLRWIHKRAASNN